MPKPEIELTTAEWTVIKAVVGKNEPCTAPDVQQKLDGRKPVGPTMALCAPCSTAWPLKGLLNAKKRTQLSRFTLPPSPVRRQVQRGEVSFTPSKIAFNGALTPMDQCLIETGELNAAQLAEIESLIKAKKKHTKK